MIVRNGRQAVHILDAMALTGVSRRSVYDWIRLEKVEAFRNAGGRIYIYTDTLYRPVGRLARCRTGLHDHAHDVV